MVACEESGQKETGSLEPTMVEQTKKFLKNEEMTLNILEKFCELNSNPELRYTCLWTILLVVKLSLGHGKDNLQKMPVSKS